MLGKQGGLFEPVPLKGVMFALRVFPVQAKVGDKAIQLNLSNETLATVATQKWQS